MSLDLTLENHLLDNLREFSLREFEELDQAIEAEGLIVLFSSANESF
jgi:hypothetical protein